jgi:hypothetical protein
MPDFVVQKNIKNGKLDYFEVKYRKDGRFSINNFIKGFPYKNAVFIIVSKNSMQQQLLPI